MFKEMWHFINYHIQYLNHSKFFAGLVMLMLNIGSKYVTIQLSETQEQILRNNIGRQLLIFSICWMGTRDIYYALGLTATFIILSDYLFNEKSSLCVLPESIKAFTKVVDINDDGVISQTEIDNALKILEKVKNNERKVAHMKLMMK